MNHSIEGEQGMAPRTKRTLLLLAAACAALPISACSGSEASPKAATAAAATASAKGVAAYRTALTNLRFLTKAEGELVRRCMRTAGFTYVPAPPAPAQEWDVVRTLSVDAATRSGYASLVPDPGPDTGQQESYVEGLSSEQQQGYEFALLGNRADSIEVKVGGSRVKAPTGGCQTQAEEALYADRKAWIALHFVVTNLRAQPEADVSQDADLLAATKSWHACMVKAGRDYPSPGAAVEYAFGSAGSPTKVAADSNLRALALADAQCRVSARWTEVYVAATRRGLQRAVAAHESELLAYEEMQREAVVRAKKALG